MKQLFFTVALVLIQTALFAAAPIRSVQTGKWDVPSTWNSSRTIAVNDTVIVEAGTVVTVDKHTDFSINNIVLKVYGTLRFSTSSARLLLGSGSKVFVYSGGTVTSTGSPSQRLNIGINEVYRGDEAPISGPQMASAANDFQSFEDKPLPVKFISFTAAAKGTEVVLQWATSEEVNADRYEIQRSTNGATWTTVGTVKARGNFNGRTDYTYSDKAASGSVYYRLRQVDIDSRFTYTAVRAVRAEGMAAAALTIRPAAGAVALQFAAPLEGSVQVRFTSISGQVLLQQTLSRPSGQVMIPAALRGQVVVSVSNGKDFNQAQQVLL